MQAVLTQALSQPKPVPADPFDPKKLLTPPNPSDATSVSNADAPARAPKAVGTGLLIDKSA
jgi:hypothetical protein